MGIMDYWSNVGNLGIVLVVVFLLLIIIIYIYHALALMKIAKRFGDEKAWYAWVPVLDAILMARLAKKNWYPALFYLGTELPIVGTFCLLVGLGFSTYWMWHICELRGKPGYWAVLIFIPVVGWVWYFVYLGILAWGNDETPQTNG